jgi:hypothetical protein
MGQVIVRGDGQWTNDQLNEMVKRLGEDTEIAVSRGDGIHRGESVRSQKP